MGKDHRYIDPKGKKDPRMEHFRVPLPKQTEQSFKDKTKYKRNKDIEKFFEERVATNLVDEVKHKYTPSPGNKPKRRQHQFQNKSQQSDYMKDYMTKYRKEDNKDYQKKPDGIKSLLKKQRERLKKKFNLKAHVEERV
jgi:hypothetical protein